MKIIEYAEAEGGDWKPWPAGIDSFVPSDSDLSNLVWVEVWARTKAIHGIQVHAFKTNMGAVWDAVNGWRKRS